MTYTEAAKKYGITVEKLRQEQMNFLQSEGFDESGREYHSFESWLKRKKFHFEPPIEPRDE